MTTSIIQKRSIPCALVEILHKFLLQIAINQELEALEELDTETAK